MFIRVSSAPFVVRYFDSAENGVATKSRLLEIIGFFCKRALQKRRYSAKETYHFKEPTNRSHPIPVIYLYRLFFEHFPKKKYQASQGHTHVNMQLFMLKFVYIHKHSCVYIHTHLRTYTYACMCTQGYTQHTHADCTRMLWQNGGKCCLDDWSRWAQPQI